MIMISDDSVDSYDYQYDDMSILLFLGSTNN